MQLLSIVEAMLAVFGDGSVHLAALIPGPLLLQDLDMLLIPSNSNPRGVHLMVRLRYFTSLLLSLLKMVYFKSYYLY